MRTIRVTFIAMILASGLALEGQEPVEQSGVVFRAGTDLVQVDVAVLDSRRRPVTGLTAADFTVLENGQPRPVETFSFIDLPDRVTTVDAAWTRDVPSDVATNHAGEEGRLVVILMDRTIPVGFAVTTAKQIATTAVENLGPGDLGAVVSTGGGTPQNLTSDRQRLLRAINQRDWSSGISADAEEVMPDQREDLFSRLTDGRCLCGLCGIETVTRVASALENMPRRRKSVLFIGSSFVIQDGIEMGTAANPASQQSEMGCALKLKDARKAMFEALDRSGVTIHSIDPSGLNTIGPISQASSPIRGSRVAAAQAQATHEHVQGQGELRILPERTGGRVVMNTNGPQDQVPEIFRESQSYYLLGFRPADPAEPGSPRSIEVKVSRRDARVHARRQFVIAGPAPAAGPADASTDRTVSPLAAALSGLLPDAGLPLEINAAAFAGPEPGRAAVVITVGVDAFAPTPLPGWQPAADAAGAGAAGTPAVAPAAVVPIEIVAAAYDQAGRPQATARQALDLSWPVADPAGPRRVEVLSRLDLPPGDYEIRVAAAAGGRSASVFTQLAIPPFDSAPLVISNIVMRATGATSTAPKDFLSGVLPVVPTAARTFARADGASAFVRVYQGTARSEAVAPVGMRVRILDSAGRTVRDEGIVLGAADFEGDRAADARLVLPLASLANGDYLLSLEASIGPRVAGRVLRFSVR